MNFFENTLLPKMCDVHGLKHGLQVQEKPN